MLYVWIGSISFLFFTLSDLNQVRFQRKILLSAFPAGCITLVVSTSLLILSYPADLHLPNRWVLVTGIFAMINFVLLMYSLTVVHEKQKEKRTNYEEKKKLYDRGLYAMCRHPGVLFFLFFYLTFSLAMERSILLFAGGIYSILNIAYSLFQDRVILSKLLTDYEPYRNRTPFLIPTKVSLRNGIRTLKSVGAILE